MSYSTKNYNTNGGDKTVIGGEIAIVGAGKLTKDGQAVDLGGSIAISDVTGLQSALNGKTDVSQFDSLTTITDPATATAESIANKVNEIINALKA